MIRCDWVVKILNKSPAHHAHYAHRIGRHVRRAAGVAVSKPAIVGYVCTVVAGGAGMSGLGWPKMAPAEHPASGGVGVHREASAGIAGAPAPLAYLPPEAVHELPPGPLTLPPLSLPPESEIIGPATGLPEMPELPPETRPPGAGQPPAIQFPPGQPPQPVPEPGSLALLLPALAALAMIRRRI